SVKLDALGQTIPTGHRLEVSLSTTYWPQAWPSPKPVTLNVITNEYTKLRLPVRSSTELDREIKFKTPETATVTDKEIRREETRKERKKLFIIPLQTNGN